MITAPEPHEVEDRPQADGGWERTTKELCLQTLLGVGRQGSSSQPPMPSVVVDMVDRAELPPPRINVGIVDASPYYAEAVAYAIEPDDRFRPISCFLTPDYIPSFFDGVIVLTVRDQSKLDDGLMVTAAKFPHCPLVLVTPTVQHMEYLSLIAYPGIAFRLNELGIEALKRAIVNASNVAAACGRTSGAVARLRRNPEKDVEIEPYASRVPAPRLASRFTRK